MPTLSVTDLFAPFPPNVRTSDPETSHQAAKRIEPKRGTHASQVLSLFRAHKNGLTATEVDAYLSYRDPKTGRVVGGWWKRASDLLAVGLLRETGETRDGARVLVAVD